jgi:hypothetical protein
LSKPRAVVTKKDIVALRVKLGVKKLFQDNPPGCAAAADDRDVIQFTLIEVINKVSSHGPKGTTALDMIPLTKPR